MQENREKEDMDQKTRGRLTWENARNLKAIRRGMDAIKNGDTTPAEQVFAEVRGILGMKHDA